MNNDMVIGLVTIVVVAAVIIILKMAKGSKNTNAVPPMSNNINANVVLPVSNDINAKVFCVHCGKHITAGSKFCEFCGKPQQ